MMRTRTIQHAGFLFLLVLVTIAFGALVQAFFQTLFWSAVMAIAFRPVERQILAAVGGRQNLAAALATVAVILLVFVPVGIIGVVVSREAVSLYDRVSTGEIDVPGAIATWQPRAIGLAERLGMNADAIRGNVRDAAGTAAQLLASQAFGVGRGALSAAGRIGLMLYLLFFFLRDGDQILEAISRALPLGDERERVLFARFTAITRATLKGTLVVGAAQGALGGLLFWALGIGAPAFWGVMMTAVSLVPLVGSALIWAPTAIFLMATGSVAKGIILLAAGGFGISLVDNILRPILVGRETRIPDYVVLISTLGGIGLFGLSGFIAGPAIAGLFLTSWDMFAREYARGDKAGSPGGSARAR